MSDVALLNLLRLSAQIVCTEADERRLSETACAVKSWHDLPEAAERHGLAPLVDAHLRSAGINVPVEVRRQLVALCVRHRRANEVRLTTLREVLDAFEDSGIQAVVLKGAALARLVYPSPGLRPMSDLDLLVDAPLARRAQSLLGQLGFAAPLAAATRRLIAHHHLSPATQNRDGHVVQIEIHRNALSHDSPGSLTTRQLTEPPRPFSLCGRNALTLGHLDMLYHLCRHVAERAPLLRLIWVADIVGYAMRFHEEIDWARLRRQYPFVLNALALLDAVNPLPPPLARRVVPAGASALQGVGVACKPLATALRPGRRMGATYRDILYPSDWWLRLYYGVNATASLFWCRWVRHPLHVGWWLLRRVGIFVRWRAGLVR